MKEAAGFVAFVGLTIVIVFGAGSPATTWSPPLGIPVPPFGINETAGPFTHYVDNTSTAATDTNNSNGSPSRPRKTIPYALAAGSVVEVHGGPYIYNSAGKPVHSAIGTAQKPVFIRGIGMPLIQGLGTAAQGNSDRYFWMTGSYYIVEGFKFSNGTTLVVVLAGDHGVLRSSEVVNLQPPGYSAGITALGHHHVIYNNHIHHNGNYLSAVDNKVHGIILGGAPVSYVWILNNEIDHNGGQAMQIGADSIRDYSAWPHHIYIGFNDMHGDMEAAIAMKQARDVIISQNYAHDYLPYANGVYSGSSQTGHTAIPTTFAIGRFGTHRVWVLFNTIRKGVVGIRSNGNIPDPPHPQQSDVYIIGNVISDIHSASYDPASAYSEGAAIVGWQNTRVYVVDNTIVNAGKGISFTSTGYYEVTGNLLENVGDPMSLISTNWGANKYDYNFYDSTARLAYASPRPTVSLTQQQAHRQELHSKQGSALLDSSFKPTSGSPAIDANVRSGVYDTFLSLYGIDIAKDIVGTPRPQGAAWDIGAYEFAPGAAAPPGVPPGTIVR